MSESLEKPLVLNDSIKDSTDPTDPPALLSKGEESGSSIVSEEASPTMKKIRRRYNILQVCSGICVLIAIVIIFALPPLIQMAIVEQAKQQVIMTPDN